MYMSSLGSRLITVSSCCLIIFSISSSISCASLISSVVGMLYPCSLLIFSMAVAAARGSGLPLWANESMARAGKFSISRAVSISARGPKTCSPSSRRGSLFSCAFLSIVVVGTTLQSSSPVLNWLSSPPISIASFSLWSIIHCVTFCVNFLCSARYGSILGNSMTRFSFLKISKGRVNRKFSRLVIGGKRGVSI